MGAGARSTIIDAGGVADDTLNYESDALFEIMSEPDTGAANASISGVTLTGGSTFGEGGAIRIDSGSGAASLKLTDSTVTGNEASSFGGGISNRGDLTVERVTFSNNWSEDDGGAIYTGALGFFTDAAVRGVFSFEGGTTTVTNSTIVDNVSDSNVGCAGQAALDVNPGTLTVINSDVIGNRTLNGSCEPDPEHPAGGIGTEGVPVPGAPPTTVTVVNSIVAGNTAAPNLVPLSPRSGPDVDGSAAAPRGGSGGPVIPSNCSNDAENGGSIVSEGHNIEDATDCGFTASGDQQNVTDPKLGSLADNGGQMDTLALLDGSPALDKADATRCPATDERGIARPQGAGCDIGAFEVEVPVPPVPPAPPAQPAKPAPPKVGVAGVRRACVAKSFNVRLRVATTASVKRVTVRLDGKRIKSTTRSSFTLKINGKKLKSGRHRLTVTAVDSAGQTTTTRRTFSVCKAATPRRRSAPRFTG